MPVHWRPERKLVSCSFAGCPGVAKRKGMCMNHYSQLRRGSTLKPVRPLSLTVADRFWAKVKKGPDCWEWQASTKYGYGRLGVGSGVDQAHRVSWRLAFGAIPKGMVICHRCDNPPCVRPEHLFLGTHADNVADKVVKGRAVSKLKPKDVVKIRALAALKPRQQSAIAREYGINKSTVSAIIKRKTWRHVP